MAETKARPADLDSAKAAEEAYSDAQAALGRAGSVRDAVKRRIDEGRRELAALDARILELAPDDVKPLMKLDGERTAVRVGLEVLGRKSLPEAEGAVAEAELALEAAERALAEARAAVEIERLRGELARVEGALVQRTRAFRAEAEALVETHRARWTAGRGLAGAAWDATIPGWPDTGVELQRFLEQLGHLVTVLAPPAPSAWQVAERARLERERAAERAREDKRFRSVHVAEEQHPMVGDLSDAERRRVVSGPTLPEVTR